MTVNEKLQKPVEDVQPQRLGQNITYLKYHYVQITSSVLLICAVELSQH